MNAGQTGGRVLRAGIVYAGSSAVANGMRFILVPLLARALTKPAYGIYTIVIPIVSFGTMFATLGLDAAIARAWYDRQGTQQFRALVLKVVAIAALVNGLWIFGVGVGGHWWIPRLLPEAAPEISRLVWYIAALIFLYPFTSFGTCALQAQFRPLAFGTIQSARAFIVLAFVGTAFWNGYASTATVLAAEGTAAAVAGTAALVLALGRIPRAGQPPDTSSPHALRSIENAIRYGLPIVPASVSNWAMAVSDRLVLARYVAPAEIAVYGLGYSLPAILGFVLTAVNSAYVPHFFEYAPNDERIGAQLQRDSMLYAYAFGWLAAAVALAAPEVATLAGGRSYLPAAPVTRIVVFALYIQGFYLLASLPLYQRHRTRYLPLAAGVAAVANLVLNFIFVPHFGIIAAAWNTLIAYFVLAIGVTVAARRLYPIRPLNLRTLSVATMAAVLTIACIRLPITARAAVVLIAGAAATLKCASLLKTQHG